MDEELVPRLRKSIRDYKKLKDPKNIMTNGNKKVFATATGTIWGYIIDQAGKRVPVRISATFAPGLGRRVFSSIKAMQSGVSTIFEMGNPHLQFDSSTSLPLTQHPEDKGVCSYDVYLCTLGSTADTSSAPAVVPAATGKQRRQSRRLHLQRNPRISHQLQHSHGAHHDGNVPTKKGIRAVWTESCDPIGVHTIRWKQHARRGYCHGD